MQQWHHATAFVFSVENFMKSFHLFLFELYFTNIKFISPKSVNLSTADQLQIDSSGGCGWSEKIKEIVENKIQVVASPETGETAANWSRDSVTFHGFNRQLSECFTATRMAWWWSASHELPIGTNLGRWSSRKQKQNPVWVHRSGWPNYFCDKDGVEMTGIARSFDRYEPWPAAWTKMETKFGSGSPVFVIKWGVFW